MFLEEIKPYIKDLEVYQVQQSLPNEVKRKAIFAIFDKHIKFKEYPSSAKTSIGCGACVKNVMNRLFGLLQREQKLCDRVMADVKEVGDKLPKPVQRDLEDQIKEEKISLSDTNYSVNAEMSSDQVFTPKGIVFIKDLRWGELKKYATSQGIKVAGKKKVQILKELGV
jgi:hypothetical protein